MNFTHRKLNSKFLTKFGIRANTWRRISNFDADQLFCDLNLSHSEAIEMTLKPHVVEELCQMSIVAIRTAIYSVSDFSFSLRFPFMHAKLTFTTQTEKYFTFRLYLRYLFMFQCKKKLKNLPNRWLMPNHSQKLNKYVCGAPIIRAPVRTLSVSSPLFPQPFFFFILHLVCSTPFHSMPSECSFLLSYLQQLK